MKISKEQETELINLWHLSKVPHQFDGRWERLKWTASEFNKAHPDISYGWAYKHICRILEDSFT